MAQATLTIDLAAIRGNWRRLAAMTGAETGAVVKANAYGLGVQPVAQALAEEGARKFFVAQAEEGLILRKALGPGPEIFVFSGHMDGDADRIRSAQLVPMLNSVDQMLRHFESLPGHAFGVQLDTGMNRLGMEAPEWRGVRGIDLPQAPKLVMSHLACADAPEHMMNRYQLETFKQMTGGINVPRSFSATGGILLGKDYHFDVTRPGIGLYGGMPYAKAQSVVTLDIPVIQVRELEPGESVGYSNTWVARRPSRIATIGAGYADGIIRAMGPKAHVWAGTQRCAVVGRISMDLIGVDVTALNDYPDTVSLLGSNQTVDQLAEAAGTIGYEILTSLGNRYHRRYSGA